MKSSGKMTDVRVQTNRPPQVHTDALEAATGPQATGLASHAQRVIDQHPDLELGTVFADAPDASWQTAFSDRSGNQALFAAAQQGDRIVFADLLASFHSVKNCLDTIDDLATREIAFECHRLSISSDSPTGRLAVQVIRGVVEQTRRITGAQNRARTQHRRELGLATNGQVAMGFKLTGSHGRRVANPDLAQREIMRRIVELRDGQAPQLSWDKIADVIELELAAKEDRKPIHRWNRREWGRSRCQRGYTAAQQILANEAARARENCG